MKLHLGICPTIVTDLPTKIIQGLWQWDCLKDYVKIRVTVLLFYRPNNYVCIFVVIVSEIKSQVCEN